MLAIAIRRSQLPRISALARKAARTTAVGSSTSRGFAAAVATVSKDQVPPADQDRVVVNDAQGNPILVAKVHDTFYAVEATCPHMNKSMEKGKILTDQPDGPEIRCRFHNSRFSLKTGKCTQWVTGAFGVDSSVVGGLAQKVGGEKRNVRAFQVIANEDGSLTISED